MKILRVLLLVAAVAVIGAGVALYLLYDALDTSDEPRPPRASPADTCAGKVYPGARPGTDRCADANGVVLAGGIRITAGPLRAVGDRVCAGVTLVNRNPDPVRVRPYGFSLLDAAGAEREPRGPGLAEAELDTLAEASGEVCFAGAPADGLTLVWTAPEPGTARAVWPR